jgi:transcription-repair coupling factor (superfamily II helicase)
MIRTLQKRIENTEAFRQLKRAMRERDAGRALTMSGVNGSLLAFVAAWLYDERDRQVVVIVPEEEQAEQLRDDCALLVGDDSVRLAVFGGHSHAELLDVSTSIATMETLQALAQGTPCIVIASAEGVAGRLPSPEHFRQKSIQLVSGTDVLFEELLAKLRDLGFEQKEFVEGYGDFAVRGGIVDVFPFVGENPLRLEFWGDSIESIREFDILSQRSIRQRSRVQIVPGFSDDASPNTSLLSYLRGSAILILDKTQLVQKEIEDLRTLGRDLHEWKEVRQQTEQFTRVEHRLFESTTDHADVAFSSTVHPSLNGNVKLLVQRIRELNTIGLEVVVSCDTNAEQQRMKELLEEELTAPDSDGIVDGQQPATGPRAVPPDIRYSLASETVHAGFVYPAGGLALFTEHEIFGRLRRRGLSKRLRSRGFTQKELLQLRRGDFVVHADFGVGKFAGLEKIKVRGAEQEVMKILYQDNDALYVHLNSINRVRKYSSKEGQVPQLTQLGTAQWDRLKARAKKRVKDIARELISLYAKRKTEHGFAFAPDSHWQKEMEASFMYEDTPDQATTTADVKRDMELPSPMDRLVCGDVGFGKTEVAVRAVFKAVLSGKQAAVLVPTTILAQQHYNTFLDRLGRYSVKIEAIHRFKARKDQKVILGQLQKGVVDVLIGTHRLLSKDVVFTNLGLLVIDEEQRFGVSAKEKLRQLRANVDTLTLTATPIPRTLHFSLMGARDLSLINTPPRNRRPILTEIAQFDVKLIREAILREIRRGGQVYFVHDRVQTIDDIQQMLKERIPEARVHVAHGQMKGHELEKTMMAFLDKQYDVLVCTKIIESGIDIPSVNTIIVNRADRFGLAELYQLRGRVGRSNEQAYAFLLTPPVSVLPKQVLRRLQALQEFNELGSGFNLAMRDLEIRGAGNLLGAEQSGFIIEMGFEMYQKIMDEAVTELKEQEFAGLFRSQPPGPSARDNETSIETDVEALIPDFYVESDAERLDIYRRLYDARTEEELQSMRDELKDRFGNYPEEVENLFLTVGLKIRAQQVGFQRIELRENQLRLGFPPEENREFYGADGESIGRFQAIMAKLPGLQRYRSQLKQQGKRLWLDSVLGQQPSAEARLDEARKVLNALR